MADIFSAESRLIHAGTERAPGQPATPPLVPASMYVSQGTPRPGRGYGRDGNPGWEALEQALGGLEDAEAVAFASGQAASMALMLALALLQRPLDAGATASLYSLTKAISGHSDVILGAADAADTVVASSRLILPATSFGGVESTWERRARWPAETAPAGLIRLSVGVEPAADLITDIDQALEVL
jgi:cystathionine beta-lyase/cystathionine gamma-synthase